MDRDTSVLIDFESMGPGQFERDVGDFLGGIAKFGQWSDEYLTAAVHSAIAGRPHARVDTAKIVDYTAYACLWPKGTQEETERGLRYRQMASRLLGLGDDSS